MRLSKLIHKLFQCAAIGAIVGQACKPNAPKSKRVEIADETQQALDEIEGKGGQATGGDGGGQNGGTATPSSLPPASLSLDAHCKSAGGAAKATYEALFTAAGADGCAALVAKVKTGVSSLVLKDKGLSDIGPLAYFKDLSTLDLSFNRSISDLAPLAGLTKLQIVLLTSNAVTSVKSIQTLASTLNTLGLDSNGMSDAAQFTPFKKLKILRLGNNKMADVKPLSALSQLDVLVLGGNPGFSGECPVKKSPTPCR